MGSLNVPQADGRTGKKSGTGQTEMKGIEEQAVATAVSRRIGRGSRERDKAAVWECVTGERSTRTAPVVDYDVEGPEQITSQSQLEKMQ